jgi:hypothetical protein
VTYQIKTKQGKEGQLIVKRYLTNEGKTEVAVFTLKLNAEPDQSLPAKSGPSKLKFSHWGCSVSEVEHSLHFQ